MTDYRARPNRIRPEDDAGSIVTDGDYVLTVAGGKITGLTTAPTGTSPGSTVLVPLTTVAGGVPDFVWDDNDELVLTEVTL